MITSHINPDGDAIGSQLALYEALTRLGKQVSILNSSPTPGVYRFLPFAEAIQPAETIGGDFDLVFVLDCAEAGRTGTWTVNRETVVVNVDHHYNVTPFGHLNYHREAASSTAELIYELLQGWEVELNVSIATNIYVGIMTDTGSFRFDNTTAKSLDLASRLVKLGVNPQYVAEQVYESLPPSTPKLLGCALEGMELSDDGQIASLIITRKMLQQNGAEPWETENFINFPKSIMGVRVAILFHQMEEDYYKVSLRSKGEVNVAQIAREFNGGGHYHAAGCRIRGSLAEVKTSVTELVHNYLQEA
jgi:phosphoesterase RecJ-like protein